MVTKPRIFAGLPAFTKTVKKKKNYMLFYCEAVGSASSKTKLRIRLHDVTPQLYTQDGRTTFFEALQSINLAHCYASSLSSFTLNMDRIWRTATRPLFQVLPLIWTKTVLRHVRTH